MVEEEKKDNEQLTSDQDVDQAIEQETTDQPSSTEKEESATEAQAQASDGGEQDSGSEQEAAEEADSDDEGDEEGETFGSLFEESLLQTQVEDGEILRGVVISITKDHVMVDIGGKSEGQIAINEFLDQEGNPQVQVGDEVDVLVESREDENEVIRLSKDKAEKRIVWDELEKNFRDDLPVNGTILEKVKGGLNVDIGVKAFLPGSQADIRPVRNLDKLIGLKEQFKLIKFNRKRGNVVVSRRSVLEADRTEHRDKTLAILEKDQVVEGVVKNITDYGAFIDLGGVDGLLHITDMSYGRINHPSEVLTVGQDLKVKVLKFNRETERVSLGLKQILPDPWDNVEKKYPVGTIVFGKIASVTDYGSFVELEQGVEGLVHVSEMTWNKKRGHPSKIVELEQEIEAKVLDIDILNRRISLSMKQAMPNPWDQLEEQYPADSVVKGRVRNITNFGVFVGIDDAIDGLVHISDLSWTKRVKHPSEILRKGQEVECKVLKIDKENERFSLGIKQVQPDPWEQVPSKYRPGADVIGKVVNITDFGVFVELEEGIEALIHVSELSREKIKDPSEIVQTGQEVTAEILNVDMSERKIRLSVKALERAEDHAAYQDFRKQEGDGTSKLGELIQDKLSSFKVTDEQEAEQAADAPVEEQADAPAEEQADAPVEEQAEAPAEEQAEAPAEEQAEVSVEEQAEETAELDKPVVEESPEADAATEESGSEPEGDDTE